MYFDILHKKKVYILVTLVFFFNWHVFPEFSKLNDTFIFLEEDGRLFIIDNFKKVGFLSGMPFLNGNP